MKAFLLPLIFALSFSSFSASAAPSCREVFAIPRNSSAFLTNAPSRVLELEKLSRAIGDFDAWGYDRYGHEGMARAQRLAKLDPSFQVLIVDPGLVLRLDQFEKFVVDNALASGDPWAARQAFAESLGTRKVYRSLVVDSLTHQAILKSGIESNLVRSGASDSTKALYLEGKLDRAIADRMQPRGENKRDPLLSVSDHVEVASAATSFSRVNSVGSAFSMGGPFAMMTEMFRQGFQQTYVYELRIPEIDIVHTPTGDRLLRSPVAGMNITISSFGGLPKTYSFSDRQVESFILLKIEPSEIVSARLLMPHEIATASFSRAP